MRDTLTEDKIYPNVLQDMQGYLFTVATLPYAPFIRKSADGVYSGMEIELANYIAKIYNFRYYVIRLMTVLIAKSFHIN